MVYNIRAAHLLLLGKSTSQHAQHGYSKMMSSGALILGTSMVLSDMERSLVPVMRCNERRRSFAQQMP